MTAPLSFGSLFSGIGGLDLGLEWAGLRLAWQCESDAYCREVLAKRWPGVPCYPDARCLPYDVPAVDLLCGGFPCQPVSLAGPQLGTADERWLWPDCARALRLLRPRYALLENVPGLTIRGMGDVLGALAALGYSAEWGCVPAAAVGAPHLRWRIFILADADGETGRRAGAAGETVLGPEEVERFRRRGSGDACALADAAGCGCVAETLADAECDRPQGSGPTERPGARWGRPADCSGWESESGLGRMAYGIPHRLDRLRALGNAVVPQVAEMVGRRLLAQIEAAA